MTHDEAERREIVHARLIEAEQEMAAAEEALTEEPMDPSAVAFHSEEAAEMYLKALLAWHELSVPKPDNVPELLDQLHPVATSLVDHLREAIALHRFGGDSPHADERAPATPQQARHAHGIAQKVARAVLVALPATVE